MFELTESLEKSLEKTNTSVDLNRFKEISIRLLGSNVLVYGDSQVETQMYNDAVKVEHLIEDYFSLIGCRLLHDSSTKHFRLYPPGASIPGIHDDDIQSGSLRERLSQHEIIMLLILRFHYDKSLNEGSIDDDNEAMVTMHDILLTAETQLNYELPQAKNDKYALIKKMKKFKLVRYPTDFDATSPDSWLSIRPMIVQFVSADAIEQLSMCLDEGNG